MAFAATEASCGTRQDPGPAPVEDTTTHRGFLGAGVAGTAAVALLLATQRWGAYLGVPGRHLFLTDLLLVSSAAGYLSWWWRRGGERVAGRRGPFPFAWPGLAVTVLFGVGVLRYLAGPDHGAMALRDAAPWGYAVVAFLSAQAVATASARARVRARNVLLGALVVHLVWAAVMLTLPEGVQTSFPAVVPGAPVRLLELRPDIDGALIGILAGWGITRLWRGEGRTWWWLAVSVASYVTILQLVSRVGPLAAAACTLIALLSGKGAARSGGWRRAGILVLLAVSVAGVTLVLPASPSGTRLIGSVLPQEPPSRPVSAPGGSTSPTAQPSPTATSRFASPRPPTSAPAARPVPAPSFTRPINAPQGTMRARVTTWRLLLEYIGLTPQRVVLGVGFGPNIVHESGATAVIGESAASDVRSPHDFPITVFARTGAVGLLTLVAFSLAIGAAAWRTVHDYDDLRLLSLLIVVGLAVGSLVGVVMEAPFGAVPVYWAAGVLLSRPWRPGRSGEGSSITSRITALRSR